MGYSARGVKRAGEAHELALSGSPCFLTSPYAVAAKRGWKQRSRRGGRRRCGPGSSFKYTHLQVAQNAPE